jgi:L-threonylcarbamoyladenylate synthase
LRTQRLPIDAHHPQADVLARAGEVLRSGGLVAFPTETVYGLAANALSAEAVERIYAAKGRPLYNPMIVHVADQESARDLASQWPPTAALLAERFWPGPLTLVVRKRDVVPPIVTAGGPTVGLRVPSLAAARALIEAAGVPLAAPSANRAGRVSPTTADHVWRGLAGRIDLLLDGGPTPGGLESTVLDVSCSPPRLLRPGLVSQQQLELALGAGIQYGSEVSDDESPLRSPGLLTRHYAPQVAVECVSDDGRARVEALAQGGVRVGWLALGDAPDVTDDRIVRLSLPRDASQYAAGLYAALHALEDAGVECMVIALPPDTAPWLAVRDRLARACARD